MHLRVQKGIRVVLLQRSASKEKHCSRFSQNLLLKEV